MSDYVDPYAQTRKYATIQRQRSRTEIAEMERRELERLERDISITRERLQRVAA